jgi:hypothetical protein
MPHPNILTVIHSQYKNTKKRKFSDKEKVMLRPIAEVVAILDGNAFFGLTVDENGEDNWYEQYLPEAWMIYNNNPSVLEGTSWYRDHIDHGSPSVEDAYNQWRLIKLLSK